MRRLWGPYFGVGILEYYFWEGIFVGGLVDDGVSHCDIEEFTGMDLEGAD